MDDGQPQPGAFTDIFGREERLEDPLFRLRIHPRTGVSDGQADVSPGREIRMPTREIGPYLRGLDRDVEHVRGRIWGGFPIA
jgi:hypothetical protein